MKLTYFFISLTLLGTTTVYLDPNADNNLDVLAFQQFKKTFNKQYQSQVEESYRFSVFLENLKIIQQHNADVTKTYTQEVNQFCDLTIEEFKARHLVKPFPSLKNKKNSALNLRTSVTATTSQPIDWSTKNVLPAVKNQQQCGSMWAFSTAGLLESVYNIQNKPKTPISFSEQQLVDCCGAEGFGCEGCNGAWPTDAVSYVQKFGIVQENQYPYIAKDGNCNKTLENVGFKPSKQFQLPVTDAALQAALQNSPISIVVDASQWNSYASGVFPQSKCSSDPNAADHAVLLVGYNSDGTWKVRNSWGTSWGQKGYITLAAGNTCGLENYAIQVTY
ncbi:hypothetical protein ABPG74_015282 [Tetrahymena malaccensis]